MATKYPFYSSVCQVCQLSYNIKRCGKCKLMPYCSAEHQRKDWPFHKKLCNAIAISNVRIPYEVKTYQDMNNYKVALKLAWQITLRRNLTQYENTIYLNLRYCRVCYKKECPIDCLICLSVAYCSEEHKESDLKHFEQCQALYLCRITDSNQISFNLKYIDTKNIPLKNIENLLDKTSAVSLDRVIAGHLLSSFGTILYALDELKIVSVHLSIHIVGASIETKYNWTLLAIQIFAYYPKCQTVQITFIGPEAIFFQPIHFEIGTRKLYLVIYPSYYHDVDNLDLPHLSVALNCGIHESYSWWPSLPLLARTPFVITAYLYSEIVQDKICIQKCVSSLNIIKDCIKNPFASPKPFRNWDSEDEYVYYSNNYILMCDKPFHYQSNCIESH